MSKVPLILKAPDFEELPLPFTDVFGEIRELNPVQAEV
jgi:hypothetical protein